jgi:hypothetical protein
MHPGITLIPRIIITTKKNTMTIVVAVMAATVEMAEMDEMDVTVAMLAGQEDLVQKDATAKEDIPVTAGQPEKKARLETWDLPAQPEKKVRLETLALLAQPEKKARLETSDLLAQPEKKVRLETLALLAQPEKKARLETSDLLAQPEKKARLETSDLLAQPETLDLQDPRENWVRRDIFQKPLFTHILLLLNWLESMFL